MPSRKTARATYNGDEVQVEVSAEYEWDIFEKCWYMVGEPYVSELSVIGIVIDVDHIAGAKLWAELKNIVEFEVP